MLLWKHFQEQRGVYMTMGRISRWREFTPVLSRGSVFVYMIPSPRYLTRVNPSVVKRATTKCLAGASHTGVSSPRLLHRSENFTPVRNFVKLLICELETTPRFGVKSVCRSTGTCSTCVVFVNSGWRVLFVMGRGNSIQTCKRDMITGSHLGMKLAPVRVFSC